MLSILYAILLYTVGVYVESLYKTYKINKRAASAAEQVRIEKENEWKDSIERDQSVLNSTLKAQAQYVSDLSDRVQSVRENVDALRGRNEALAVDKEAREAYASVMQRLGAFEQALSIQHATVQQLVAVITPPVSKDEMIRQQNSQPRPMTFDEQLAEARRAAQVYQGN